MAKKKRGLNPKALEQIHADRANPPTTKHGAFAELEQRYPGYDTITTVEDSANKLGFTYDELFGGPGGPDDPYEDPFASRPVARPASATSARPAGPSSQYFAGNPPPPANAAFAGNPPPPSGPNRWARLGGAMDSASPYLAMAGRAAKAAVRPSPYAPMTWIEHQMSSEGRGMLYGRGPQTAPLYGIETRPYQIQPRSRRSPEEVFTSPWHDPNVATVSEPGTDIGYPSAQPNMPWGEGPELRGTRNTPSERLHRTPDPLHENVTGTLWGTTHDAAIGNVGGDVHTRTTRGFGGSQVDSIRAPEPKK